MDMKVVIIGNGIGGVMTASRLRTMNSEVEIEIYTREPYEYYSRIRLPEVVASNMTADDIEIYQPNWYEDRNIQVFKNTEVVKIHREEKEIEFKNGTRENYDKLVLATGSDSFKPPIKNVDLDGVFTIREYGDADAIRSYIKANTKNVVIIGGGLLGLESARHIADCKLDSVTIIEIFPRLLPKQLDQEGADLLKKVIENMGCDVILGASVQEILGEKSVSGVRLKDGRELPAQTVLISAGIRPRIQLAKDAGLETDRGVIVDNHLRSSDKDIFVAGDLVEYEGIVWGIIPAALDHAPVVASNILGNNDIKYKQTIPKNTLKVVGVYLTSVGKVAFEEDDPAVKEEYRIYKKMDRDNERYEKYTMKNGKLTGAILLGSKDNLAWVNKYIGKPVTEQEIQERFWD